MENIVHKVQFCVVGGGLAGMCAALAAARHGVKTLIMQERPVFGGNASSEIRMWICGSGHDRETGIVEELRLENLYRNTYPNYSVWDSILYEKIRFQPNLTCLLNCSCLDAQMENGRLKSIKGWQMTTQTFHTVEADFFADCSGDSILAPLSGAEFRIGREEKSEFDESLAQDKPDRKTMGMSCILQARETDSPKKFIPPAWADKFPSDDCFPPKRGHKLNKIQNFWYLEYGGDQDSIRDSEEVRDDLLKTAFGLWDHIKNHGDHEAENWILDWVGFLPGKRESRRYVGDYILNQRDVLSGGKFSDIIAFGGWPIDDHHPGGFRYFGVPNMFIVPEQSYGIPVRCIYSKNIPNLLFAGRNISTTHTGLSSTRVMATCATLGEAVGVTAFYAIRGGYSDVRSATQKHIGEIQQTLLDDDCYLLWMKREVAGLTKSAKLTASSGDAEVLRNGSDRSAGEVENAWHVRPGDWAEYDFGSAIQPDVVRLVFDSDLKRDPLNMVANYTLKGEVFTPPVELVKSFHLEADGREIFRTDNNYQRLVKIPLDAPVRKLKLVIDALRDGCDEARIFDFEVGKICKL